MLTLSSETYILLCQGIAVCDLPGDTMLPGEM